jgi:hypothetical protein
MHFRALLLQKGLDLANATVPDAQNHPIGATKVCQGDVPLRSTSMEL